MLFRSQRPSLRSAMSLAGLTPEGLCFEEETQENEEEELREEKDEIEGHDKEVYADLEKLGPSNLVCFSSPVSSVIGEVYIKRKKLEKIGELSQWKIYKSGNHLIIIPSKPTLTSGSMNAGLYQLRRIWESVHIEKSHVVEYQDSVSGIATCKKRSMALFSGDAEDLEEDPKVEQLIINPVDGRKQKLFPSFTQLTGYSACFITLAMNSKVQCKCTLIKAHINYITPKLMLKALSMICGDLAKDEEIKDRLKTAVSHLLRNQTLYM